MAYFSFFCLVRCVCFHVVLLVGFVCWHVILLELHVLFLCFWNVFGRLKYSLYCLTFSTQESSVKMSTPPRGRIWVGRQHSPGRKEDILNCLVGYDVSLSDKGYDQGHLSSDCVCMFVWLGQCDNVKTLHVLMFSVMHFALQI